ARTDLMDGQLGYRLVGPDHSHLRVQFVAEVTVFTDRIDRDLCFAAVFNDAKIEFIVVAPAHGLTYKLRPEFRISVPGQPLDRPAIFQVRKKCGSFSKAILPSCKNWILPA